MLHKVFPDKEKAKSIYRMALDRVKFVKSSKIDYPNIVVENLYEIIKEFSSAILLMEGIKAIGENAHKEIIDNLKKYVGFNQEEISILQDLRIKRNNSMYEGKQINPVYLENNKQILLNIADRLKKIVEDKLK